MTTTIVGSISTNVVITDYAVEIERLVEAAPVAAQRALFVVAQELLRDSKLYVPVQSGKLRDSGKAEIMLSPMAAEGVGTVIPLPTSNDAIRVCRVIYGSEAVKYAALQHDKSFRHPGLGFTGPAKYLEKPMLANYKFYQALFVTEFQLALKAGLR